MSRSKARSDPATSDTAFDVTRLAQALFGQIWPETENGVIDITKTPEYAAMRKEQERPCDRCGIAVGSS